MVLSQLAADKPAPTSPKPKPKIMATPRPYTLQQLAMHKGIDGDKSIWIAVKGKIYDVSAKSSFYGPGAGYHIFAGRDATRALALTSLDPEDVENTSVSDIPDLSTLNDWVQSYNSKYDVIGWIASKEEVDKYEQAKATSETKKTE